MKILIPSYAEENGVSGGGEENHKNLLFDIMSVKMAYGAVFLNAPRLCGIRRGGELNHFWQRVRSRFTVHIYFSFALSSRYPQLMPSTSKVKEAPPFFL